MFTLSLSPSEKEQVRKFFDAPLEEITPEAFRTKLRELRKKYHPDTFDTDDERVLEMANAKFQELERIAAKVKEHLADKNPKAEEEEDLPFDADAKFAYDKMRIELITSDKDLKFKLFKTVWRYLERGDKAYIPGTKASLIIDEDHLNQRIGFIESVKMYLTFSENDDPDQIVDWLWEHIKEKAIGIKVEGKKIAMNPISMKYAIRKKALLELPAGE